MADQGQRTEQPTQQKLKKARDEGRFPVSREMVFAAQFFVFTSLVSNYGSAWIGDLGVDLKHLLLSAPTVSVSAPELTELIRTFAARHILPLMIGGLALYITGLVIQMGSTGFGVAFNNLSPQFSRLMPGQRLMAMPKQNLGSTLQAAVLIPLFSAALSAVVADQAPLFLRLPFISLHASASALGNAVTELLWKATGVFVAYGVFDLFRQRQKYTSELKMSKQEIRDEAKQSDGNPEIKMRIRRLRRDLLRRRMMAEVPNATAVIVNPTHFAVAIRYNVQDMAAPKVVAKGKNYLALRIKKKALEHQVPVIENPPLAQSLYKSVDVGQEIPAHLYRAVAEILAYIYRIMNGRLPG